MCDLKVYKNAATLVTAESNFDTMYVFYPQFFSVLTLPLPP